MAEQTWPVYFRPMFICNPPVVSQLCRLVTALVRRQSISGMPKPLKKNSMLSANIRTLTSTHDGKSHVVKWKSGKEAFWYCARQNFTDATTSINCQRVNATPCFAIISGPVGAERLHTVELFVNKHCTFTGLCNS